MVLEQGVFIGLLPGGARRPSHYAVFDIEQRLLQDGVAAWDELPEILNRYPRAAVAIAGPLAPNPGLLSQADYRARYDLPPDSHIFARHRVAEYQLYQAGIAAGVTPVEATAGAQHRKLWSLVTALYASGWTAYQPASPAVRQVLEIAPRASFAALLGRLPLPRHTLEGRVQRQLLLANAGLPVSDAMRVFEEITRHHLLRGQLQLEGLRAPAELDVFVAALTARYALRHLDRISLVGDPADGQIVLPAPALKSRYT